MKWVEDKPGTYRLWYNLVNDAGEAVAILDYDDDRWECVRFLYPTHVPDEDEWIYLTPAEAEWMLANPEEALMWIIL